MKQGFTTLFVIGAAMLAAPVRGAELCEGSPEVPIETLLSQPDTFLNKRVQFHAVLSTDGKEYVTLINFEEGHSFILTTTDETSTRYSKDHP